MCREREGQGDVIDVRPRVCLELSGLLEMRQAGRPVWLEGKGRMSRSRGQREWGWGRKR